MNFDKLLENYEEFWNFENACVHITSPSSDFPKTPKTLDERWNDKKLTLEINNFIADNYTFFADGFANLFVNYGPGCISAFLENPYKIDENTVWFDVDPIIKDMKKIPDFGYKKSSLYNEIINFTKYYLENKSNNLAVSITDLGGGYDILASLRGTKELIFDLYDYPDEIKILMRKIDEIWKQYANDFFKLIFENQNYVTSWMPILSKLPYYPLQCDFCAMISKEMFNEFVFPNLRDEADFVGRAIYHLDGKDAVKHLDSILEIDSIKAIQWSPGAGNFNVDSENWLEMYKKINGKKKGLVLMGAAPENVLNMLDKIDNRGLFISAYCQNAEDGKLLEREVGKKIGRNY